MENTIIDLINNFGYMAILLLIAVENIFPPIPSEVILTFGGFMTTCSEMNIWLTILFATIGSVVGAIALYYIGRILSKERLIKIVNGKIGRALHFKESDIDKAEGWFGRFGKATVFFCRFIPIVRSLISIPAGMAKMNLGSFLTLTTIGSLIWNGVLVFLGKVAGASWPKIVEIFSTYSHIGLIALIVLFVGIAAFFVIKHYKKKKQNKE